MLNVKLEKERTCGVGAGFYKSLKGIFLSVISYLHYLSLLERSRLKQSGSWTCDQVQWRIPLFLDLS